MDTTQVPELQAAFGAAHESVGDGAFAWGETARGAAKRLVPWIVPLLLLAAWQAASQAGWLAARVLPAPVEVLRAGWTLAASGELWTHVKVSAGRALLGLAVGGSLGLAFGLLTGSFR